MTTAVTSGGATSLARRILPVLAGPAILLITLAIPAFGPLPARFGFGILFWMVYWWTEGTVDIKVTCLVPLLVAAVYPFLPLDKALQLYVHPLMLLIVGTCMITAGWARWGFAKRMALRFLLLCGNDVQIQMVAWFLFCGVVSFVVSNTAVAAIFIPIAGASLAYAGFSTFDQRYRSAAASNILIAVSWGASVGGMTTPLGGGQAVVTLGFLEKYIGHEVFFVEWLARMLPLSLLVMAAMSVFMYIFMKPEIKTFKGSREYYAKELKSMGPMSYEEKAVCFAFLLIVVLALTRPLYVQYVQGPAFRWLQLSPLFFIIATALFFMPSKNSKGENILSVPTLIDHFPITILFIWPASVALGRLITQTGASTVFAQWLEPFVNSGDMVSIVAFTAASNLLSQALSDTAAAGVMMPLVIAAFKNWHGLQYGAVAFIWITGAALSFSYAMASSTGAQGIAAGYGANLKRMFIFGMIGGLISIVVTILYFVVAIDVLHLDFYLQPPTGGSVSGRILEMD